MNGRVIKFFIHFNLILIPLEFYRLLFKLKWQTVVNQFLTIQSISSGMFFICFSQDELEQKGLQGGRRRVAKISICFYGYYKFKYRRTS